VGRSDRMYRIILRSWACHHGGEDTEIGPGGGAERVGLRAVRANVVAIAITQRAAFLLIS
jgi:hypothetical protein